MKKEVKYLVMIVFAFISLIVNVNAGVNVESKPGHSTRFGYNTQTQTYTNGSCTANIYCIDKGKANQSSFKGCTFVAIDDTAFASVTGDHDTKEYLYRVIASNSGLTKTDYYKNYTSVVNPTAYGYQVYANVKVNLSSIDSQSGSYTGTYDAASNTYTAVINLNQPNVTFTASGANISQSGNGPYTIVLSGFEMKTCEGAKITLTAKGASSSSTTGNLYYVDCHNTKQNYIIESGNCSMDELSEGKGGTTFEITIPDPNCSCDGDSTLCIDCAESGESHDNKDRIKECANNGGFKTYCDTPVRKTSDTGTSDIIDKIASYTGNVTPSSMLSDNEYCNVFCLEDIKYELPGVLKTKDGRYFKLRKGYELGVKEDGDTISITGTRKCITDEIKKSKFIDDVENEQKAIINTWNTIKYNKAYNESLKNVSCETKTLVIGVTGTGKNKKNITCSYEYCKGTEVKYDVAKINSFDGETGGISNYEITNDTVQVEYIGASTCSSPSAGTKPTEKPIPTISLEGMYKVINQYKSCFQWTNNYCFDPEAYFNYDEVYASDINGKLDIVEDIKGTEIATYYNDVNADYTGNGSAYSTKKAKYIYATEEILNNTNESYVDVIHKYVKKEVTSSRIFKDATKEVWSYHPYGTITTNKNDPNCSSKPGNCVSLGYVLPVALQHKDTSGIYPYYIDFEQVGVGGDDTNCSKQPGRINGCTSNPNNSLTAIEGECTAGDYSCYYTTKSCPECEIECVCPDGNPNCTVVDKVCMWKVCPDCEVKCVGCIWNNGDTTIAYKTISLDNVYEDDNTIGSNWTQEDVENIEEIGQEIYNIDPIYSFTLTPTTMGKIREYNKKANETNNSDNIPVGGYNNDTLICNKNNNNDKYNCISSFLRDYLKKNTNAIVKMPEEYKW